MATILAPGAFDTARANPTGDSTNTLQRANPFGQAVIRVSNTAGGTPTITLNIQGSCDGTTFFNIPYATTAAPQTAVLTAITLTATATNFYITQTTVPWLFCKLVWSAPTNETVTADLL